MWLFPCWGEEAVGYSLYHRQSTRGDVVQKFYLLTRDSWRLRVLQCCFHLAVGAGRREGLTPFLVERLLFHRSFFFSVYVIVWMYWQPPRRKKKSHILRRITTMSFKSLKEFGVSAERLGSICKRWMARVQRSVSKIFFIFFTWMYPFCQSCFHNVVLRILVLRVPD